MKIEPIKFSQEASGRVYKDYMKRVRTTTASLSQQDQDDVYMEFNSHIFEAIQHRNDVAEIDALLNVLEKLGTPEEVLKPLIADKKLTEATTTFNPVHVFKALILNFTNGISYFIFFFLYLFLFAFVFLILAKILNPSEVGLFYKKDTFMVLGISRNLNNQGMNELLGNFFIPVMVLSIVLCYFILTLLLKLKKSINKK
ncbi:hypothetical protein [Pedobacter sp. Leaf176]|uniref:HAAS signaling domain-containing protein n=1 Tax=Pedobacter sp. Leaf176 TaxID=1736286 RepID=UPI0006FABE9C|nr:hypothetical protein [Pedobacter sp. Leaf176]KQR67499.1 hypothetical protein ASF92_17590 [Pedobacter sp. Leaf176]